MADAHVPVKGHGCQYEGGHNLSSRLQSPVDLKQSLVTGIECCRVRRIMRNLANEAAEDPVAKKHVADGNGKRQADTGVNHA